MPTAHRGPALDRRARAAERRPRAASTRSTAPRSSSRAWRRPSAALAQMDRAVIFSYDDARRRVHAAGSHGIALDGFTDAAVTVESAPVARQALTEDRVIEVLARRRPRDLRGLRRARRRPRARLRPDRRRRAAGSASSSPSPQPGTSPIDERQRDLLWMLGKTLALASTSRIATTETERARELEERIDFARDIHDGVVQRLFGVSLALSSEQPLTAEARARCARRGAAPRSASCARRCSARSGARRRRPARRSPPSSTACAPSTPTSA